MRLVEKLSEMKQALAILFACVSIGFTLALIVGGYVGLPTRVEALELQVDRDSHKLDRVLCLVEALAAQEDPVARGCAR